MRKNINIENIQQEFFPLFDKVKRECDPIHNARVSFNIAKSLIERGANWNKDEVYEVLQEEFNKMERAQQELEKEAERVLSRYIIDDDVKGIVKGVSIYGNHASITLGDNKKEFKISEFLNSGFCQKNGISGFSTLHSNGKSEMHGFVTEEGEGKDKRKVRHYVVIDGLYEMTLNWYDKEGKKCTIKINIDANGIKFIEGNMTQEQLKDSSKANWAVKIGGLFLHEIEFRKTRENEINTSFKTATKIVNRSIQVTDINREVGSQNAMTSTTNSHAPAKGNTLTFGYTLPRSQRPDDLHKNEQILDNQQQPETQQQDQSYSRLQFGSKDDLDAKGIQPSAFSDDGDKPITVPSKSVGKESKSIQSTNPSDQMIDELEKVLKKLDKESEKTAQQVAEGSISIDKPLSSVSINGNNVNNLTLFKELEQRLSQKNYGLKQISSKVRYVSPQTKKYPIEAVLLKDSSTGVKTMAEAATSAQPLSTYSPKNVGDSGYLASTYTNHYNSQVPEQLKTSLMNAKKSNNALLTEFASKLDKETQKFPFLETELLKDSFTDIRKAVELKNANTSSTIKNRELYKLLEKDKAQLKVGVIEEIVEGASTEYTDIYDRNRITLGNKNRELLWTKYVKKRQEKGKSMSI
ncbi:hypothetical protein GO684_02015 [Wolbachia endosymbiont of Litomosoides brasiliensis]|nr:hypothetical protein [Wolbachia endosymbiont of Litomosoides brasiliensis]